LQSVFCIRFPSREAIVLFQTSDILRLLSDKACILFSKKISTRFLKVAEFVAVVFFVEKMSPVSTVPIAGR